MFVFLILVINLACLVSAKVEEFQVHGPMDLHSAAMEQYILARKENPNDKLEYDGPLMKRARKQAVRRMMTVADEELSLRVIAFA